jgi:hypothetical protein
MSETYGNIKVNLDAPDTSDFTLRQYETYDSVPSID